MKKGKWNNRIVAHKMIDPEQLLAHPNNWRVHPKAQRDALKGAIKEVGFVRSVTISEDGTVIDGHLRVALALSEGQKEIPVEVVNLSEDEIAKALLTIDPLSAMAGADKEQLDALLREVETADAAVMQMLDDLAKANGLDYGKEGASDADAEPQIDKADELRVKWGVERGQVWQLGEHRLMCGDSTSAEDVARLMDVKPAATITDPPYGMRLDTDYTSMKSSPEMRIGKGVKGGKKWTEIAGDGEDYDPAPVFALWNAPEMFLFGADYYAERLPKKNAGSWLVWDKRLEESADKMYGSGFELCWSKKAHKRDIIRVKWAGVFGTEREDTKSRVHPSHKPTLLFKWIYERYTSAGAVIADPYLGGGSSIIACEQLGRKCRAMEISEAYTAVALERWHQATGKTPALLDS